MKKIIGILGVAVIAVALFLSTNTINTNDADLASILALNVANAESDLTACVATSDPDHTCTEERITVNYCLPRNGSGGATCSVW